MPTRSPATATGAVARLAGFERVSLSHEVAREIKAVARGDTTAADADLTPLLRSAVARLGAALGPAAAGSARPHRPP